MMNFRELEKWLQGVEPGDRICIRDSAHGYSEKCVSRTTKTRIIADGTVFKRSDGRELHPAMINRRSIEPFDAEKVAKSDALQLIESIEWARLSLDQLQRVLSIVDDRETS